MELLLPAGNLEKLRFAFQYGADAVYCGTPAFSLRYRVNAFTEKKLSEGVEYAHGLGKKIYVTVNIYPHEDRLEKVKKHLKFLKKIKPDAIIFSDQGVFNLIQKICPEIEAHLSVQATATNSETLKFWQKQGVTRVILARELSIKEIKKIHQAVPKMEIECFVHGAICMSYSGRCLLSNYLAGRDANQGDCAHPCRWKYRLKERDFVLEEDLRKGDYYPVYENDHGSHILSARDLCAIEYIKELRDAGVVSLKVEGRAKSIYYLSMVTRTYRQALDNLHKGKRYLKKLRESLLELPSRGYTTGFLLGKPPAEFQQYDSRASSDNQEFIGVVRKIKKDGLAEIEIRNRFQKGNTVEFVTPEIEFQQKITQIYDKNGREVEIAHGGQKERVYLKPKKEVPVGTILRKK